MTDRALRLTISLMTTFMVCWANGMAADEPPNVSSTNQSGGVTAGSVGTINNYGPMQDALRKRLGEKMELFNRKSAKLTAAPGAYYVALDSRSLIDSSGSVRVYMFTGNHGFTISQASPSCELPNGAKLTGVVTSGAMGKPKVRVAVEHLSNSDPLLGSMCSSLGRPLSWLDARAPATGKHTVYDYLALESFGVLVIALAPGAPLGKRADATMARTYWATAFAYDYLGDPESGGALLKNNLDPGTLDQVASGGDFSVTLAIPSLDATVDAPYPSMALKAYGGRIEAMDHQWLDYLQSSSVTINGEKRKIMMNGKFAEVLPQYSLRDVSTTEFWRHLSDMRQYMVQLNCIGARFAVDYGYARAVDLPAYDQCPLWQIRADN